MTLNDPRILQRLTDFENLLDYLRDELDWPIEAEDVDEATFDYTTDELSINPRYAVKIDTIKQLRPLVNDQVWGIFFIEFDGNRLPVMALRRILQSLAISRRQRDASLPAWKREDLLFICVYTSAAEGKAGQRGVTFAHFRDEPDSQPELRTFSWDSRETHFHYIRNLNLAALRWPRDETDGDAWRVQWRKAFTVRHRYTIRTAEKLASQMAKQAVTIRELIEELYDAEGEKGALHGLYERLRIDLIHDLQPDDFADMIAQTITYGVFSAAVQSNEVSLESLANFVPDTNPFLQQMLRTLTSEGGLDLDELGVGQLVDLLRQIDLQAITRDFGRRTGSGSEDPIVHFYEQFLNEYDREQRIQRGVFYTPDPVVNYIVRAVDQILQRPVEEGGFGIEDGLASEATTDKDEPLVQILDPATGTGTFLAHIIDHIAERINPRNQASEDWNNYVAGNLLKRLNGFELMMAPYTIAHLKLGLKLAQTGYTFGTGERLRVFLTNALEKPVQMSETLLETDYLSREANEASIVKRNKPIMVVIGNPPYSGHSANTNIEDWFKLNDYYFVDGKPLGERNPKWLQDDYVKFIRFGQWRIEQTGEGVLAFISNHGYLDNPTFRGMRQQLLQTFDLVYVLDLHGNTRKKETTPDGSKDENVFDIQQGVSIAIFIRNKQRSSQTRIFHRHVWGIRETKYTWLMKSEKLASTDKWTELRPVSPFYLLVPEDRAISAEYTQGWRINELFSTYAAGMVTARDSLTVQFSLKEIRNVVHDFASLPIEVARQKYNLGKDVRDWKVSLAQSDLNSQNLKDDLISPVHYRPFDFRFTYYTGRSRGFICMPRPEVMGHMLAGDNLGLISARSNKSDTMNHFLASRYITEAKTGESTTQSTLFTLYEYPTIDAAFDDIEKDWPRTNGRRPNLSRAFVDQVTSKLNMEFVTDGRGDLHQTFGPEDIFHYAYAIFHSPTYRTRYGEQLKIDFPRLPLTDDVELFRQLVMRGVDLVALHLLEDDYEGAYWNRHNEPSPLTQPITEFVPGKNRTQVGSMSKSRAYDDKLKRIYLDTSSIKDGSYFQFSDEINAEEALETWGFQIGGYQVLHKWLYDRRAKGSDAGRVLTDEDIEHYQRVVVSLYLTRKLMDEIDEMIDEHGGFPLRGSAPEDADVQPPTDIEEEEPIEDEFIEDEDSMEYTEEDRKHTAYEQYQEAWANASGVDYEGEDLVEIIEPFDPTLIRIDSRQMSLDTLISRLRYDEINLNPDFQRMAGIWPDTKQSLLIESLLIRIPLPAFYMDASDEHNWLVIDGLQRLTTLYRFILAKDKGDDSNVLRLQNLEFLGKQLNLSDSDRSKRLNTWDKLPRELQRRIQETQVTVFLMQPGTPPKVKYNIFKRINTGGVPLTGQEIRNALNVGQSTAFLRDLAATEEFKIATDYSISPMRMVDQELALRFLAFNLRGYQSYREGDLDSFLNEIMADLNQASAEDLEAYESHFKQAMLRSQEVFGNQAFRKRNASGRRSPVSKALFEIWSVQLGSLSDKDFQIVLARKDQLEEKFIDLLDQQDFDRAISYATGSVNRVQTRFGSIERILREVIND